MSDPMLPEYHELGANEHLALAEYEARRGRSARGRELHLAAAQAHATLAISLRLARMEDPG